MRTAAVAMQPCPGPRLASSRLEMHHKPKPPRHRRCVFIPARPEGTRRRPDGQQNHATGPQWHDTKPCAVPRPDSMHLQAASVHVQQAEAARRSRPRNLCRLAARWPRMSGHVPSHLPTCAAEDVRSHLLPHRDSLVIVYTESQQETIAVLLRTTRLPLRQLGPDGPYYNQGFSPSMYVPWPQTRTRGPSHHMALV